MSLKKNSSSSETGEVVQQVTDEVNGKLAYGYIDLCNCADCTKDGPRQTPKVRWSNYLAYKRWQNQYDRICGPIEHTVEGPIDNNAHRG